MERLSQGGGLTFPLTWQPPRIFELSTSIFSLFLHYFPFSLVFFFFNSSFRLVFTFSFINFYSIFFLTLSCFPLFFSSFQKIPSFRVLIVFILGIFLSPAIPFLLPFSLLSLPFPCFSWSSLLLLLTFFFFSSLFLFFLYYFFYILFLVFLWFWFSYCYFLLFHFLVLRFFNSDSCTSFLSYLFVCFFDVFSS